MFLVKKNERVILTSITICIDNFLTPHLVTHLCCCRILLDHTESVLFCIVQCFLLLFNITITADWNPCVVPGFVVNPPGMLRALWSLLFVILDNLFAK